MPSTVIPVMRYRDAARAIDWLEAVFGFERHLVVEGEGGRIAHAQLVHGTGMVMVGSVGEGEQAGGGGIYVVVDDVDGHAEHAAAGGAQILMAPQDEDYGGRLYVVRDLEGNVWSFGSYDPWGE